MDGTNGLAWNLYTELRKEIVATQHLRSRAIEFKITLIGAAFALFVANLDKITDRRLLILPAFAAIFFDFLIASYNFGIKRQSLMRSNAKYSQLLPISACRSSRHCRVSTSYHDRR